MSLYLNPGELETLIVLALRAPLPVMAALDLAEMVGRAKGLAAQPNPIVPSADRTPPASNVLPFPAKTH